MTARSALDDLPQERFVEQVMGLPVTLAVRGRSAGTDTAARVWRDVMGELRRIDALFSTYRPESAISRIGRGEIGIEGGPDELVEVLELADAARRATAGAFDVWRTDETGERVFDPSGVVKGWALERAASSLQGLDDTAWCLSGGGDMVCSAGPADFPPWRIGIENPTDPREVVGVVEVRDGGVATSGTAHRGQHIRDARDGRPPRGIASVTVVAATLTGADIEATCGFLMGTEAASWLARRPLRRALLVTSDGDVVSVEGLA